MSAESVLVTDGNVKQKMNPIRNSVGIIDPPRELIENLITQCNNKHQNEEILDSYCPWVFDGWSCFNSTPADTTAKVQCPSFIMGFDSLRLAHRECLANGTWFHHPISQEPWSNYTTCIDHQTLELHQTVNRISITGYCISLCALALSLLIFYGFTSLNCTRVSIHKNLFVSFLLNNLMWMIWHLLVAENTAVLSHNGIGCQILHVLCQYFLVSSYTWMFCEGLYLHILLVVTFLPEHKVIPSFLLLGWGLPFILTSIYAGVRGHDTSARNICWVEELKYRYILSIPVVLSMVINVAFLINIVRVLVTKLRAVNSAPSSNSTRKAVRATLILIPLLGLHFILIPFRPSPGSPALSVYLIISAVASSFQGFAVSLLFCFCNGEVISAFRNKRNRRKVMRVRTNCIPPAYFSMETLHGHPTVTTMPHTNKIGKSSS